MSTNFVMIIFEIELMWEVIARLIVRQDVIMILDPKSHTTHVPINSSL